MTGPSRLPYRIAFVPPTLGLPPGWEGSELPCALLVAMTCFEHFVRHGAIAVADVDDVAFAEEGRVVSCRHPGFEAEVRSELQRNRRDEVLWLDLAFVAPGQVTVRLMCERPSGRETFAGPPGPLSWSIGAAFDAWLGARRLPPAPRPLPTFSDRDLLTLAAQTGSLLDQLGRTPGAPVPYVPPPPVLAVPFFRVLGMVSNTYVFDRILPLEPDNPTAMRDDHLARWHDEGAPRAELGRIFAVAPWWGKAHALVWGDDIDKAQRLYHASLAATLCASNPHTLVGYGGALWEVGRRSEAFRIYDRAARYAPMRVDIHHRAMDVRRDQGGASGAAYVDAAARLDLIERMAADGAVESTAADVGIARLCLSNALFDVGRREDAVAQRDRALSLVLVREDWPKMHTVLETWRADPDVFAASAAREGWYAGDYARAAEWSARAPIDQDFDQLAQYIESLLVLARPRAALIAWAQYSRRSPGASVVAQPVSALAMLANGLLEPALDALLQARLRSPSTQSLPVVRALRVAATHPVDAWASYVASLEQRGAFTLARLVARDAADFVPGACNHPVLARTIATIARPTTRGDVERALTALRAAFGAEVTTPVDALFQASATRADADRMVARWFDVVGPGPEQGGEAVGRHAHARKLLYLAASCICRYLGGATPEDGVIDGACRVIALEALASLSQAPPAFTDADLTAALGALEPFLAQDPWLVDGWLLALERALDLEEARGGKLEPLVAGLPNVAAALRGPERLAADVRSFMDAQRVGNDALVASLGARVVRATTGNDAIPWVIAAARALPPAAALDVAWIAYHAHPSHGRPAVELAKRLATTLPEVAFDVLCERLGWMGGDEKTSLLEEVRPSWPSSLGVPFDYEPAMVHARAAFGAGRLPEALRALRWCDARNASDEETLRMLGSVHAQLGDAVRSVACFSESDARTGPIEAARALLRAGHARAAAHVFALAGRAVQDEGTKRECAANAGTEDRGAAGAAWSRLEAGDVDGARQAALDRSDPRMLRAALAAQEVRTGPDARAPLRPACLELVKHVLAATAGAVDLDATLARHHALRIREQALLAVDPKPPMGQRPTSEALEKGYADRCRARSDRGGAIVQAMGSLPNDDADPVVFAGMPVARLGQYVAIVRGMQSGDFAGTLARAGLDMQSYAQIAGLWGQRLAADPALHARFTQMLMGR